MDAVHSRINKFKFPSLPLRTFVLPVSVVLVIVIVLIALFAARKSGQTLPSSDSSANKVSVSKAKATQMLNKIYSFPLKDPTGKDVSKFQYTIESVEKRDEIIVKGKRAVAIEGRTFLVFNLKIKNDFNRTISISAKDYIRVTVNNSSDKYAPDINNDPVEVQPDSTKSTRLALPINDTDKDLTMMVGELEGKKETVKLNLR